MTDTPLPEFYAEKDRPTLMSPGDVAETYMRLAASRFVAMSKGLSRAEWAHELKEAIADLSRDVPGDEVTAVADRLLLVIAEIVWPPFDIPLDAELDEGEAVEGSVVSFDVPAGFDTTSVE